MTPHQREDSVAAHDVNQHVRGGSIPASSLHFWHDEPRFAQELVERFHYSRRWPSNVQSVTVAHVSGGLFGNKGDAVGAVVFTIPGTRWRVPVWELARLVRGEQPIALSALVAAGVRRCRKQGAHLLVSFADRTHGHHGGIYQACGWAYNGLRKQRIEGVILGGEYIPQRNCRHKFGSSLSTVAVIERESKRLGLEFVPKFDEGKHLYWLALTPTGAKWARSLQLAQMPYPKKDAE